MLHKHDYAPSLHEVVTIEDLEDSFLPANTFRMRFDFDTTEIVNKASRVALFIHSNIEWVILESFNEISMHCL